MCYQGIYLYIAAGRVVRQSPINSCPNGFHKLQISQFDSGRRESFDQCGDRCDAARKCSYFHFGIASNGNQICYLYELTDDQSKSELPTTYCLKSGKYQYYFARS